MTEATTMKVFCITDCEWWIGADLASVVEAAQQEYGLDDADVEDAAELSIEALDALLYVDTDEDGRPAGTARTFREQLAIEVAAGGQFPRMFAVEDF